MLRRSCPRGLAPSGSRPAAEPALASRVQTRCRAALCRGGVVLAGEAGRPQPLRSRGCLWRCLRWRRPERGSSRPREEAASLGRGHGHAQEGGGLVSFLPACQPCREEVVPAQGAADRRGSKRRSEACPAWRTFRNCQWPCLQMGSLSAVSVFTAV